MRDSLEGAHRASIDHTARDLINLKLNQLTCYIPRDPPLSSTHSSSLHYTTTTIPHRYHAFLAQNLLPPIPPFFSLRAHTAHPTPLPPPSFIWFRNHPSPRPRRYRLVDRLRWPSSSSHRIPNPTSPGHHTGARRERSRPSPCPRANSTRTTYS